jgi:hypothetical protein
MIRYNSHEETQHGTFLHVTRTDWLGRKHYRCYFLPRQSGNDCLCWIDADTGHKVAEWLEKLTYELNAALAMGKAREALPPQSLMSIRHQRSAAIMGPKR